MKLPKVARGLVTTTVADELLVYDSTTEKAHCLSLLGKAVFEACSSGILGEELFDRLSALGMAEPRMALQESLRQLAAQGLIEDEESVPFSRRRFLAVAGPLMALPIVATVLAPRPIQAFSCNNCAIDAFNIPLSCVSCGGPCPAGACTGIPKCVFEYTMNKTTNGGAGLGCFYNEGTGRYQCRNIPTGLVFRYDCAASRDATIAAGGGDFTLYYCCRCSTAPSFPSQFSC